VIICSEKCCRAGADGISQNNDIFFGITQFYIIVSILYIAVNLIFIFNTPPAFSVAL
jgi:hypothetical protein